MKQKKISIDTLIELLQTLRSPEQGCEWVRQQTFSSIASFTLEETYEIINAIETEDYIELKHEVGDLLYHVMYYAQLGEEQGLFNFQEILESCVEKVMRRHPHVFSDVKVNSLKEITKTWEHEKTKERSQKVGKPTRLLEGIISQLPAMLYAWKVQQRVSAYGFDWPETMPVLNKIQEELDELRSAIVLQEDSERLEEELGDLLYSCINLARHIKAHPETILRKATHKFISRWEQVEDKVIASGRQVEDLSLNELNTLWDEIKLNNKIT